MTADDARELVPLLVQLFDLQSQVGVVLFQLLTFLGTKSDSFLKGWLLDCFVSINKHNNQGCDTWSIIELTLRKIAI